MIFPVKYSFHALKLLDMTLQIYILTSFFYMLNHELENGN